VIEKHRVGIERMQFFFHPLLKDEVFVRDCLLYCRSGFRVGEALTTSGDAGKEPVR